MLDKYLKIIKNAKNIALFSHVSPDPDTIGSTTALAIALRSMGKQVRLFCETQIPQDYYFLPEAQSYRSEFSTEGDGAKEFLGYDLLVSVDIAEADMLGKFKQAFLQHPLSIKLDHHQSGSDFAKINVIKPYSACAIFIYEIITKLKVRISPEIATRIYFGICGDTGIFRYSNTDSLTHSVAAKMLEYGANMRLIFDEFFDKKRLNNVKLSSKVLFDGEVNDELRYAVLCVKQDDYKKYDISPESDNLSNLPNTYLCCGYRVAVILKEKPDGVHCSFRSKVGLDVSKIASHFGGGGHKCAAGCMITGSLEEAKAKLKAEIEKFLGGDYAE